MQAFLTNEIAIYNQLHCKGSKFIYFLLFFSVSVVCFWLNYQTRQELQIWTVAQQCSCSALHSKSKCWQKSVRFSPGVHGCNSCVIQNRLIRPIDNTMWNKMADGAMLWTRSDVIRLNFGDKKLDFLAVSFLLILIKSLKYVTLLCWRCEMYWLNRVKTILYTWRIINTFCFKFYIWWKYKTWVHAFNFLALLLS